ncbi:MAG: nucleotidyltransferase domain-containing protein [Spirochaetota bacterium]
MTGLEEKDRHELDVALTLLKECGAREVYLFGSLARGEGDAYSDWDFAVRGLPKELFFSALAKLMKLMTRSVELVDLDEATPFAAHIAAKREFTRVA